MADKKGTGLATLVARLLLSFLLLLSCLHLFQSFGRNLDSSMRGCHTQSSSDVHDAMAPLQDTNVLKPQHYSNTHDVANNSACQGISKGESGWVPGLQARVTHLKLQPRSGLSVRRWCKPEPPSE